MKQIYSIVLACLITVFPISAMEQQLEKKEAIGALSNLYRNLQKEMGSFRNLFDRSGGTAQLDRVSSRIFSQGALLVKVLATFGLLGLALKGILAYTSGLKKQRLLQVIQNPKTTESQIQKLAKEGANVNLQDERGRTPLMLAIIHNNELIDPLLKLGVDINVQDEEGRTAAMNAVRHLKPDVLRKLIAAGADLMIKDHEGSNVFERTILLILRNDFPPDRIKEFMTPLIQAGMNINEKNQAGKTALMIATIEKNLPLVQYLIDIGADVNIQDNDGRTALMLSFMSRIKALLEKRIVIFPTQESDSDSEFAEIKNDWEDLSIIEQELLRSKTTDFFLRDKDGRTVQDYTENIPMVESELLFLKQKVQKKAYVQLWREANNPRSWLGMLPQEILERIGSYIFDIDYEEYLKILDNPDEDEFFESEKKEMTKTTDE